MTMMGNARGYDWATWVMGIMRSFIGGGGGALAGALGPMATDSDHFNLGAGFHHTLASMGVGFVIVGIIHLGIFLQTHGAPDKLQSSLQTAADANVEAGKAIADAQSQAPQKP